MKWHRRDKVRWSPGVDMQIRVSDDACPSFRSRTWGIEWGHEQYPSLETQKSHHSSIPVAWVNGDCMTTVLYNELGFAWYDRVDTT